MVEENTIYSPIHIYYNDTLKDIKVNNSQWMHTDINKYIYIHIYIYIYIYNIYIYIYTYYIYIYIVCFLIVSLVFNTLYNYIKNTGSCY